MTTITIDTPNLTITPNLIITEHLPPIVASIEKELTNQVTAPTGSGKSIGIPKALAEKGKRVFISEPTRISAITLSSFQRTLSPNISVGHAAEGQANYNDDTMIVYATSGHLRRKMFNYFSNGIVRGRSGLEFCDVFVLDETHSGSLDNTVMLSLWMLAQKQGVHIPKLVLLSATPTDMPVQPAPVVTTVPVPTPFPVETIYDAPDMDGDEALYKHLFEIVVSEHYDTRVSGDFLIFVPGAREADELVAKLKEKLPDTVVLPAYSALDSDEISLIHSPSPNGERKIVVATNVAESSITIDGATVVFDTMMCKDTVATPSGSTRLEPMLITKDSAKQRLGRVGRTRPGKCYRLISEPNYAMLDEHRIPEIDRVPLHNTVMEFLKAGINPVEVIAGVNPSRVRDSIELLTNLEMIKEVDGKIVVTACGNFAPTVPLGVRNAAFLWRWVQGGDPIYPGAVITSIIDAHSVGYFFIPRKHKDMTPAEYNRFCDEYILKTFKGWMGESPVHTYLNMWADFVKSLDRLHYRLVDNPSSIRYREWARNKSVHQRQFWELMSIVSQTYKAVRVAMQRTRTDVNVAPFVVNDIMNIASPILIEIYKDNAITPDYCGEMFHPKTYLKHVFDNRRRISAIERTGRGRIVPLATHEIMTKMGRPLGYIDLCLSYPVPKPPTPKRDETKKDETKPPSPDWAAKEMMSYDERVKYDALNRVGRTLDDKSRAEYKFVYDSDSDSDYGSW